MWPDPVWVLPLWWLDLAWVLPLLGVPLRRCDARCVAFSLRLVWPDPAWVSPLVRLDSAWVLPLFSVHLRVLSDCCVASPPRLLPVTVWVLPLMWFYFAGSEYYAPCLCDLVTGCS